MSRHLITRKMRNGARRFQAENARTHFPRRLRPNSGDAGTEGKPQKMGKTLRRVTKAHALIDARLSLFFGACARSSRKSGSAPWRECARFECAFIFISWSVRTQLPQSGSAPWRECARFEHAFVFISWSVRTQLPRKRECALAGVRAF